MRPRWARELIEEMRRDNTARVAELERWREQQERWREEDERRHERWRAEFEEYRSEWRARVEADRVEQKRRFDAIDARMESDRQVAREMLLEIRQNTELIRDVRHGVQATTEGLLRVLDEFRRNDGPSPASA